MHESDPLIRDVLDAGARGYVLKTDASRDLVTAVNAVRSNKTFFTAKVAQMVLDGYLDQAPKKEKPQPESPKTRLTPVNVRSCNCLRRARAVRKLPHS